MTRKLQHPTCKMCGNPRPAFTADNRCLNCSRLNIIGPVLPPPPVKHNRFTTGIGPNHSGAGVYTCGDCGRRTRSTDPEAAAVEMCAKCYKLALAENAAADGE